MATPVIDIDTIHKSLRSVPEFDGNPNVLIRFLNLCDTLVTSYLRPGQDLINLSLLNGILNKITGPAARTLATNGIPTTWEEIRNSLINNFSDHRDETALFTDLSVLTQGNDSPHIFYERCQHLLSTIMTYVQLHDKVSTTVEAKRTLYKNLALQTYLRGLNEPLGSRIRCMRPNSLEQALEYAQEEINVVYLQQKNNQIPRTVKQETGPKPFDFHVSKPTNLMYPPFSQNSWQPMRQTQPFQRPFQHDNAQPYRASRTQQMMRALPRSDMSTGFKIQPRPIYQVPNRPTYPQQNMTMHQSQSRPTPMSGISQPVARTLYPSQGVRDWRTHGNPPPSNYFKTKEMHMHDFQPDFYPYDFAYYDPTNYYDPYFESYNNPEYEILHLTENENQNDTDCENSVNTEQQQSNFTQTSNTTVKR